MDGLRVPGDPAGGGEDVGPGGPVRGDLAGAGAPGRGFFAQTVEKTLFKWPEMVYNNSYKMETDHPGTERSEAP